MMKGNKESVKSLLDEELIDIASKYPKGCLEHAKAEADAIKRLTQKKNQYHDKSVPLKEKITYIDITTVPGNNTKRKYNILVVEDFGGIHNHQGTVRRLSRKIVTDLSKTGKYGGTNIFNTFNICDCIELCGTGQVDAIIMDGGQNAGAIANELMESIGLSMSVSVNGQDAGLPQMDGYGEKQMWKNMIYERLESNGHTQPPCTIVPSNIMDFDVAMLVDSMLKQEDPFKDIKDKLLDKHAKEKEKAFELEQKGSAAAGDRKYDRFEQVMNQHSEELENLHFEKHMRNAKGAAKIGREMSLDDFAVAFDHLLGQNIPDNFEHTKPYDIIKGLQAIETVLHKYSQYAKDERIREILEYSLGTKLCCSVAAMEDTGYYTGVSNGMIHFVNVVSNVYTVVDYLKNQEHLKEVADNMKIHETGLGNRRMSLNEFVENEILFPILTVAAHGVTMNNRFKKPSRNFLVACARKLAKLTDCVDRFDHIYKHKMGFESLSAGKNKEGYYWDR